MSSTSPTFFVTGATGQLGRLVIDALLERVPASRIVAGVRDLPSAAVLAARGVELRKCDYDVPSTLDAAFVGIDRLLLISSNEVGRRPAQHRSVIDAARGASIGFVAYTSILHADRSSLGLAAEHLETEAMLRESGLGHAFLRNGWYNENYTAAAGQAIAHGVVIGSSGDGKFSAAARKDYADAAAAVLTAADVTGGRAYELAGDRAFTMAEYAAELAAQSGKPVAYQNLPEGAYRDALAGLGLPPAVAALVADSSARAATGDLFDGSGELGTLIGRATTPIAESVRAALRAEVKV